MIIISASKCDPLILWMLGETMWTSARAGSAGTRPRRSCGAAVRASTRPLRRPLDPLGAVLVRSSDQRSHTASCSTARCGRSSLFPGRAAVTPSVARPGEQLGLGSANLTRSVLRTVSLGSTQVGGVFDERAGTGPFSQRWSATPMNSAATPLRPFVPRPGMRAPDPPGAGGGPEWPRRSCRRRPLRR